MSLMTGPATLSVGGRAAVAGLTIISRRLKGVDAFIHCCFGVTSTTISLFLDGRIVELASQED
jgi:hypothetical protein